MALARISLCLAALAAIAALQGCAPGKAAAPSPLESRAAAASISGAEAFSRGDQAQALDSFRESLRINRSIDNRAGELKDLINIGRLLVLAGESIQAEAVLKEAASLATRLTDNRGLSEAQASLAKALLWAGRREAALAAIEKALEADASAGYRSGERLNLKGLILIESGMSSEAMEVLREAASLNMAGRDRLELANSYRAMGMAARSMGDSGAAGHFSAAYELDRQVGEPGRIAFDLKNLGELGLEAGRADEALFLLERSFYAYLGAGQTAMAAEGLDRLAAECRRLGLEEKALYYEGIREDILRSPAEGGQGR